MSWGEFQGAWPISKTSHDRVGLGILLIASRHIDKDEARADHCRFIAYTSYREGYRYS